MRHHVPEEILASHAAGTLNAAAEVLVVSHLTLCPSCRDQVEDLEAIAGAIFEDLPAARQDDAAFDRLLARIDAERATQTPGQAGRADRATPADGLSLPLPLRRVVGSDIAALPWQHRVRGVEIALLDLEAGAGSVRLLRARPGSLLPRHTHTGTEMTLVLTGSYADHVDRYGRGDVAVCDEQVDHRPVVDRGEMCHSLIVLEGPLKETGSLRWLRRLLGR